MITGRAPILFSDMKFIQIPQQHKIGGSSGNYGKSGLGSDHMAVVDDVLELVAGVRDHGGEFDRDFDSRGSVG